MAATFLDPDGDIKEVLRMMVHSPECSSRKYYRDKVKTPLEFVASAIRAPGAPMHTASMIQGAGRCQAVPKRRCGLWKRC